MGQQLMTIVMLATVFYQLGFSNHSNPAPLSSV